MANTAVHLVIFGGFFIIRTMLSNIMPNINARLSLIHRVPWYTRYYVTLQHLRSKGTRGLHISYSLSARAL